MLFQLQTFDMIQNFKYLLFIFFLVASLQAEASLDSLGIKVIEGQKFILHKVDAKETLYSIARRYHVSVADITEVNEAEKDGFKIDQIGRVLMIPYKANEFKKAPAVTPSEKGSNTGKKHTIAAGETLYSLSKKYNVSTGQLKEWNNMESNTLSIGEEIWVSQPSGSTSVAKQTNEVQHSSDAKSTEHIVDFGETIYSISRQYEVSQEDIMTWNRLTNTEIAVGQKLIIKSAQPVAKKKDNAPQYANTVQTFHNAKKGENYQSVAEMYNLKASDLKKWNDFKAPFKGGEVIKIVAPAVSNEKDNVTSEVKPTRSVENSKNIHVVASGETIYSLSDKYGVEMEDLRKWNGMDNYQLSVGQRLYIKNPDSLSAMAESNQDNESDMETEPFGKEKENTDNKQSTPITPTAENPQKQDTKAYFTVEEDDIPKIEKVKEKGVAEVIAGSEGTEKYLALHRTAKIGTIMQVRNDLNDQIVFVRVLGKLPNTGVDDKVIIRISKKAFEKLGGVDYKFPVEISYLPLKD
ncbi:hypothetical protein C9994_07420 [Marivirga lumbricoides]|uniref:LysM domain-containing protein n=1 Tax=Marivirga lumbricoides TaxID=1046115 RepID=A0A2T4DRH7_9BACT|nr:hypothetical protein C9994_07420 [Marivirga lumbricoides]